MKLSSLQPFWDHHPCHLALALNVTVEAVANAVPAVLIAIGEFRQYLTSDPVRFVRPHAGLSRHVLAARMDNDFVEAAKMGDSVLNAPLPFLSS